MKGFSRFVFPAVLVFILLTGACTAFPNQRGPIPTLTGEDLTALAPLGGSAESILGTPATPVGTPATDTAGTPGAAIPVTGADVDVMCEFCMEDVAHSILSIPEDLVFETTFTGAEVTCNSVETSAPGQQLVVCYGTALASFNLNVCSADNTNCLDIPLKMMDCPAAAPPGISATDAPEETATVPPAATSAAATPTVPVPVTPTATP